MTETDRQIYRMLETDFPHLIAERLGLPIAADGPVPVDGLLVPRIKVRRAEAADVQGALRAMREDRDFYKNLVGDLQFWVQILAAPEGIYSSFRVREARHHVVAAMDRLVKKEDGET